MLVKQCTELDPLSVFMLASRPNTPLLAKVEEAPVLDREKNDSSDSDKEVRFLMNSASSFVNF